MILDEIIRHKREELKKAKRRLSPEVLKRSVEGLLPRKPSFLKALQSGEPLPVIAEIKRKSPSKGEFRKDFDPAGIARSYEKAGAAALSVLTDERYFGGSLDVLKAVKKASSLPVLRKDFTVDEYQLWEARMAGADAVLLIAAVLGGQELTALREKAELLGLDALVEVHTEEEAKKAVASGARFIGVNNRDLRTFKTELAVSERVGKTLPEGLFTVSESGIQTYDDLVYLRSLGFRAVLVGETLMKEDDAGAALRCLLKGAV